MRKFKVLATEPLPPHEAPNAHNIGALLQKTMNAFGIEKEKVFMILRDAETAMCKAIEDLEYSHIDCFIHKLMLVCIKINSF